jgi:hypothetical protein
VASVGAASAHASSHASHAHHVVAAHAAHAAHHEVARLIHHHWVLAHEAHVHHLGLNGLDILRWSGASDAEQNCDCENFGRKMTKVNEAAPSRCLWHTHISWLLSIESLCRN